MPLQIGLSWWSWARSALAPPARDAGLSRKPGELAYPSLVFDLPVSSALVPRLLATVRDLSRASPCRLDFMGLLSSCCPLWLIVRRLAPPAVAPGGLFASPRSFSRRSLPDVCAGSFRCWSLGFLFEIASGISVPRAPAASVPSSS